MPTGSGKKHGSGDSHSPSAESSAKRRKDSWTTLHDIFADIDKRRNKNENNLYVVTLEHIKAFLDFVEEESKLHELLQAVQATAHRRPSEPGLFGILFERLRRSRELESIASTAAALPDHSISLTPSQKDLDKKRIAEELIYFAESHREAKTSTDFRSQGKDFVEAVRKRRSELREKLLDEQEVEKGKVKDGLKEVRDIVKAFDFHVLTKAPLRRSFPPLPPSAKTLPEPIRLLVEKMRVRSEFSMKEFEELENLITEDGAAIDDDLRKRIKCIKEMLRERRFIRRDGESEKDLKWRRVEVLGKRIMALHGEHDDLVEIENGSDGPSVKAKVLITALKYAIASHVQRWQRRIVPDEGFSPSDILKEKILALQHDSSHDAQQKHKLYLDIELAFRLLVGHCSSYDSRNDINSGA